MKILIAYPDHPSAVHKSTAERYKKYIERLKRYGFDVKGFCLTLSPPAECLKFSRLDRLWRQGDRQLLSMYERLESSLESCDVLWNYTGINLHPRFVERLPVCTVFQCFDDPESSQHLSRPVASAYDLALVGNIAELDTYRRWGVKRVEWAPFGLWAGPYNPALTDIDILEGRRDIDLFMLADRKSRYRLSRMDQLENAFPEGHFYGRGWSRGYLPLGDDLTYLQRAKIGPNLHNSTGPINLRTFYLPANGVLQICDNKKHLGKIFELDREVIGFDTIDECIEKCRYYLAHDRERREIAAAGWQRVMRDYNEEACFSRKLKAIQEVLHVQQTRAIAHDIALQQMGRTVVRSKIHAIDCLLKATSQAGLRACRLLHRKIRKFLLLLRSGIRQGEIVPFDCSHSLAGGIDERPPNANGKKRIAFVSPEFPTEITNAGGLANYLGRLCPTLVRMGHSVDVFTISHRPAGIIDYQGVRVHRVNPRAASLWERGLSALRLISRFLKVSEIFSIRREGKALAQAFDKACQTNPYDIVQSSDYRLCGMFIRRRPGLLHVVRCSAASTLLDALESGVTSIQTLWTSSREKAWLEQVDYLYAPSRFVAECKQHSLGLHVDVVRPPFFLEVASQKDRRRELPDRYLLHFGNMSRVKGSDLIEKALEIAWRTAPDLNMVWAGKLPVDKDFSATYPTLSSQGNRFIWLGPLEKPELYGVLEGAAAVVAPSRCDNLPNNVLESLACGVPVIGSLGASIDEVVEDGVHGRIVPIGDVEALAASLLRAWYSESPFDGQTFPPLGDEFEPHKAAQQLLDYVGGDPKSEGPKRAKEHMQAVPA